MPLYKIEIEGHNFPGADGRLMGFFATRWIEASSPEAAELAAVDMIREEYRPHFPEPFAASVEPRLYLSQLWEIEAFPDEYANGGATWAPMDSE